MLVIGGLSRARARNTSEEVRFMYTRPGALGDVLGHAGIRHADNLAPDVDARKEGNPYHFGRLQPYFLAVWAPEPPRVRLASCA